MIPWLMSEVMVIILRSRNESRLLRLHTSPKRMSSLRWANSGANSPNWVRPAVCTIFCCAIVLSEIAVNTMNVANAII